MIGTKDTTKSMVANIWTASADNQVKIVEAYLDSQDFTPNSKDQNGYTPIHAAASYGHIGLLRRLIERGGDINIQDNEGDTPLHHVEDVKTAKVMIEELNSNWRIKNKEGQTAVDYLEEEDEFPELVNYLKSLHGEQAQRNQADSNSTNGFLDNLPPPGNVDGHNIRYTLEKDTSSVLLNAEEEERRKRLQHIMNSENQEAELLDFVREAVREGLANIKDTGMTEEQELSKKRKE